MNVLLAVLAFLGPIIGAGFAWWLNEKSSRRLRSEAVEDRQFDASEARRTLEDVEAREHRRWLRDTRLKAYGAVIEQDYWLQYNVVGSTSFDGSDRAQFSAKALEAAGRLNTLVAMAYLVAGADVGLSCERLRVSSLRFANESTRQGAALAGPDSEFQDARGAFVRAVQKELGVA